MKEILISLAGTVLALSIGIWARYKFVNQDDFQSEITRMNEKLYKPGGQSHFVYRDDCLRAHTKIDRQLQDISTQLKGLDSSIARLTAKLEQANNDRRR